MSSSDDPTPHDDLLPIEDPTDLAMNPEPDAPSAGALVPVLAGGATPAVYVPLWKRRGPYARFSRWIDAPWSRLRIARVVTTVVSLLVATVAVLRVVHPSLILRNTTPAGGDMGAHVFAPAFLRDVLLPNFQLSGWSNYWYAGFPLYRFYMVIPALMIVILNILMPYGIAFKIVTVLGLLTLPFCCWAFGRLARFVFPIPELMALAALVFVFDESFYLYGGNVKSTMAGEFSFSIALSFAMLGLGLFARGLETGKYRASTAVVLALAMLSHGIVLLFVAAAVLMWLVWIDRKRLVYGAQVLGGAFLLSAFWVVPFVLGHSYMTDMKYGGRPEGTTDSFWKMFFTWSPMVSILVTTFAVIGFVVSIWKRQLSGAWLGMTIIGLHAATYLTRGSLPMFNLLWNPRLLPFIYLLRLLLMMVGIVETVRLVASHVRWERELGDRTGTIAGVVTAGVVLVVVVMAQLIQYRELPSWLGHTITIRGEQHYAVGIFGWNPIVLEGKENCGDSDKSTCAYDAQADGWTAYNFRGYESLSTYGEYRALMLKMKELGEDPAHGCGRAEWENMPDSVPSYGTTMSLMLLPHWTDGCVTSMEGVYFEASATTPYHFLTAEVIASEPSNPVRGLDYENIRPNVDMAKGAQYMRTLGVKYLMVYSKIAKEGASLEPGLTQVAAVGPWKIYEVKDTALAVGLTTEPVVVNERSGDQRERYLEVGSSWFQHQDSWAAIPATDGPADWQRIDVIPDPSAPAVTSKDQVQRVVPKEQIEVRSLAPVTVSNFHLGDEDLSFHVDKVGVPVLVRVSYFPNWVAEGAQGPYRAGANQMIVIPTSNDVTMRFERSTTDWASIVLTLIGIGMLVFLRRRGDADLTADPVPFEPVAQDPAEEWVDEPRGANDEELARIGGPPRWGPDDGPGSPASTDSVDGP